MVVRKNQGLQLFTNSVMDLALTTSIDLVHSVVVMDLPIQCYRMKYKIKLYSLLVLCTFSHEK